MAIAIFVNSVFQGTLQLCADIIAGFVSKISFTPGKWFMSFWRMLWLNLKQTVSYVCYFFRQSIEDGMLSISKSLLLLDKGASLSSFDIMNKSSTLNRMLRNYKLTVKDLYNIEPPVFKKIYALSNPQEEKNKDTKIIKNFATAFGRNALYDPLFSTISSNEITKYHNYNRNFCVNSKLRETWRLRQTRNRDSNWLMDRGIFNDMLGGSLSLIHI